MDTIVCVYDHEVFTNFILHKDDNIDWAYNLWRFTLRLLFLSLLFVFLYNQSHINI